jgi:mannose-6-phosphate isomerase-like protein (cupin superfamily)
VSRFVQLASGVDVVPVMLELARASHLWDRNPERRLYPGTPHAAMTDITVRYMPEADVTMEARRTEHRNVFWPAWHALPSLRPMVFALMTRVQATELGSILITKLPPGKAIEPHSDAGNWAPEFYNCKCHITLAGSALVRCEEDAVVMRQGDIFTFDNLLTHSIENNGDCDRIVVIVSMRCET